jgi:uncharacterized protein (TIGR00255 family)
MTGFGLAAQALPSGASLTVELRSVNSRFLDLIFKIPDELRAHEAAMREQICARLKRGKVEIRAQLERTQAGPASLDAASLRAALDLQHQVLAAAPTARPMGVGDLLRWPGVLGAPVDAELLSAALTGVLASALDAFLASREREGSKLAVFLLERCAQIDTHAQQAATLAPQVVQRQQQKFIERWNEALATAQTQGATIADSAAAERALGEAATYALRIDVAEEISRLKAHTAECAQLLAKGGELGKRLDFLIQEMHREANTLGSKAASIELSRVAMELKVIVEQMREQVQNIE